MSDQKLDIFRVLAAADKKNVSFYENLTDSERKDLQMFVVARWASGTNSALQLMLLNEYLNPYLFSLQRHQQLLWQLLTVCTSGKSQRYTWNKLPGKRETGKSNAIKLVSEYYKINTNEAADALNLLTRDQVLELAAEMGWQADDITKLKREIKTTKSTSNTDMVEF